MGDHSIIFRLCLLPGHYLMGVVFKNVFVPPSLIYSLEFFVSYCLYFLLFFLRWVRNVGWGSEWGRFSPPISTRIRFQYTFWWTPSPGEWVFAGEKAGKVYNATMAIHPWLLPGPWGDLSEIFLGFSLQEPSGVPGEKACDNVPPTHACRRNTYFSQYYANLCSASSN